MLPCINNNSVLLKLATHKTMLPFSVFYASYQVYFCLFTICFMLPLNLANVNQCETKCMPKSRYVADRLKHIVCLPDKWGNIIREKDWGNLLNNVSFSSPKGVLEWILVKTDSALGEFRVVISLTYISSEILFQQFVLDFLHIVLCSEICVNCFTFISHKRVYGTEFLLQPLIFPSYSSMVLKFYPNH